MSFSLYFFYYRGIEVRALEQKIQIQIMKMGEHIRDPIKIIVHDEMTLVASHNQVNQITVQYITIYISCYLDFK